MKNQFSFRSKILYVLLCIVAASCAAAQPEHPAVEMSEPALTEKDTTAEAGVRVPQVEIPEFIPVMDSSSPLQTKKVSLAARNTPLSDVLYTLAQAANLNLVMERGVDPELPITMTFKDLSVQNALNIIFNSADYFYTVRDNILIVQSMKTEMFELGQPNVIQNYQIDIGGDILSGTTSGEGTNSVSGDVRLQSVADAESFQFWGGITKNLSAILGIGAEGGRKGGSAFVINRMTGTIMVTATKKDLTKVSTYIRNLKKALNRQVLVEARIVEVQLSEGLKYGIDWSAVGRWFTEDSINISVSGFASVVNPGEPNFSIKILDTGDFSLLLKALQEQGDVKTLSNPRVNIMNGQTSLLSVGRNTSFISKVETTTTTSSGSVPITTFSVETNSILSGIIFGLVPYINSEGEITLTITPVITSLIELETKTIGTGENTVEIKLPTVDLREMSTTIKILDGQLIVIGGLIDKKEIVRENKVPLLGDIPILGNAFKSVEKTYENNELVIMLIPRLIS